jgi:hypothetical protein
VQTAKGTASGKEFDRWFYDLKEDAIYEEMKDAGLAISDPHSPMLTAKEEAFMDGYVERIPGAGKLVKASERAYSMYLNKLRVDIYKRLTAQMAKRGMSYEKDKEAYEQVAKYINNSTGRGDIGKLENYAPILNSLFFSPRLISSRLNMLTYAAQPRFWSKVPKEVRWEYLKDMASVIGVGMTILAIAKAGGAEVEEDPRSSDFGKIQSGNMRWDIWGGFQQYIRVVAQLWTKQSKSTATDRIKELDGQGKYGMDRTDVGRNFLRGKLAPVPSMLADFISGETLMGEQIVMGLSSDKQGEKGAGEYVAEHLLPLTGTGAYEIIKDQGPKGLATGVLPSALGVGVQVFEPKLPEIKAVVDGRERLLNKEEVEKYNKLRYEIYDREIANWKNIGRWMVRDGDKKLVTWKDLSEEERSDREMQAYSKAAKDAKEKLFGKQVDKEKKSLQKQVEKLNDKLYPE